MKKNYSRKYSKMDLVTDESCIDSFSFEVF